jgi:O-antigen ligase
MRSSGVLKIAPPRQPSRRSDWFAKRLGQMVFVCLLGLMVLTVIPYGMVDAWWEAVFECGMFVLTALWILEVLFRGHWEVKKLAILLPLILITAFAFLQTVAWPLSWLPVGGGRLTAQHTLSIDRYQTFLTARKTLALTLFVGLLLLHTSTPKRLRWLVRVVIGLGLGSALFGILRQLLQSPDSPAGFVLPYLFYGTGYGQFISPNPFAFLMEMPLGLLAGLVLGGGIRRERIPIYLAIALLVWTALVLSSSRGGIVGLTIQSIFLLFVSLGWYSARRFARDDGRSPKWLTLVRASPLIRVLLVVLIGGTLLAGVLWIGGERLGLKLAAERANPSTQDNPDLTNRADIWRATWNLIRQNPWTGAGFGTYFLAIPEYQKGAGRIRLEQAHNDYLDLAANGGIIAVGLVGWFIAIIIWRLRLSLRSVDAYRRAAGLGAAAGILSVAVHSVVDFGLQITGIAVVFGAMVVIAVADSQVESVADDKR